MTVCWVFAQVVHGVLAAPGNCPSPGTNNWRDDVCSLGGGLMVKSVPTNLELSSKNCNTFYNKSEFQKQPVVTLSDAKPEDKYTLLMVDPDAPGLTKDTYYLHWIVANIEGEDFKKGNLTNAKTITPYAGPAPPVGSGTHHYLLVVYLMRPGTRVAQHVEDSQRSRFHLGEWTQKYNLCGPVAGLQYSANASGNPTS
ncbi:protein D2-like [Macrosteles quadrilineatus]|uniref:protein D2-like n=1 Tax=Macrosteles quadrilineatus TaxID=74068 RepID=UPI0023E2DF84|nr:protein D2-like [Macrosteles quadrilineatus]